MNQYQGRPNSCKRLTTRRLQPRAAIAALLLRLRTAARALLGHSQVGAPRVPLVFVAVRSRVAIYATVVRPITVATKPRRRIHRFASLSAVRETCYNAMP